MPSSPHAALGRQTGPARSAGYTHCHLREPERAHVTVCHMPAEREWARDEDGDGIREDHNNAIEGFWTGLRNSFSTFRRANKVYLQQYIVIRIGGSAL